MPPNSTTKSSHAASESNPDVRSEQERAHAGTSRTKETLSVVTASLPVLGAVGTVFVWAAANFYVGEVNVTPIGKYDAILVKVYDKRGQETTFHTPKFQLMPGSYHLVISAQGSPGTNGAPQSVLSGAAIGSANGTADDAADFAVAKGTAKRTATANGAPLTRHADVEVKFGEKATVEVDLTAGTADTDSSVPATPKKRWWQFWRK